MAGLIKKRLNPVESRWAITLIACTSIFAALLIGGLLFLPFGANPLDAYMALFAEAFASWRGIGFTLVKATPLILISLGTIVAWRTGFGYLGFEGCLLVGAAATTWVSLQTGPNGMLGPLPFFLFLGLAVGAAVFVGGIWAGIVGIFKGRLGGNEVITSLMMNYVAVFVVQYLVSGPLRAPGDLPQSPRLPRDTWLPYFLEGTRAHSGIFIALACVVIVWVVLLKSRIGYELIVTGLNPKAARFGGINVGSRQILASFAAGGLGALAGLVEVLGVHHRLLDGLSEGTGFIGIVAALLGKLHPLGAVIASTLYAGMSVGADAMQRKAGLPASIIFIVQSLIILFILASDLFRYYTLDFTKFRSPTNKGRGADAHEVKSNGA